MKTKLFFLIAALTAITAVKSALAQDGWNDAHWGMTVAEVKKAYPASRSLDETNPRKARLQIGGFKIGIWKYDVRFFFDDSDQLSQVSLTLAEASSSGLAEIASDDLREKLVEKYGAPTATERGSNNHTTMWVKDALVIKLSFVPSGPLVLVSYKKPDPDALKKL